MRAFEFPDELLARIDHDRFEHSDPAVQRRMEMLWLKHTIEYSRLLESGKIARKNSTTAEDENGAKEDDE